MIKAYPPFAPYRDVVFQSFSNAFRQYETNGSKAYYEKLLQTADTISDKNISCIIYARVASEMADKSDIECFRLLSEGLALARKHDAAFGNMLLLYTKTYIKQMQQTTLTEKINLLDQLQETAEKNDHPFIEAYVVRDKAILFYNENLLDSARYYIQLALKKYQAYYSPNSIINFNNMLALIEHKKKNYKRAISLFNKTIELAKAAQDTAWIGIASGNKGMAFYNLKQYDSAYVNFLIDARYSLLKKEYGSAALAMLSLAKLHDYMLGNPDSAKYYFNQAVSTALKGSNYEIINIYWNIYKYYTEKNDYKQALIYHELYTATKDSLQPHLNWRKLQDLQKQFEMQLKEQKIELLEKENQLRARKIKQNKLILTGLIIFSVLLLVSVYVIYMSRKKILENSLQIKKQHEAIVRQTEELKELNKIKDKIFSVLSHDLRSPIAALKSTFDLLEAGIINEEEFRQIHHTISSQLTSLSVALDNLLYWSKSQLRGNSTHTESEFNIHDIITRNIKLLELQAKNKNIHIHTDVDTTLMVKADLSKTDVVVRNLLSNAIKFNPPGGIIKIHSRSVNGKITIAFQDSGIGINPEIRDKIFMLDDTKRQTGTEGESGTGLGLWLCKNFMEQNKGDIYYESEPGKGTVFYISLPAASTSF
jgi:signal transduction histidine kinase